jgi:hypothetical protein
MYIVHENLNPQYSDPTGSGAFISTRLNLHFEKNIKCKLQSSWNTELCKKKKKKIKKTSKNFSSMFCEIS